jgi:hypothetical protein
MNASAKNLGICVTDEHFARLPAKLTVHPVQEQVAAVVLFDVNNRRRVFDKR